MATDFSQVSLGLNYESSCWDEKMKLCLGIVSFYFSSQATPYTVWFPYDDFLQVPVKMFHIVTPWGQLDESTVRQREGYMRQVCAIAKAITDDETSRLLLKIAQSLFVTFELRSGQKVYEDETGMYIFNRVSGEWSFPDGRRFAWRQEGNEVYNWMVEIRESSVGKKPTKSKGPKPSHSAEDLLKELEGVLPETEAVQRRINGLFKELRKSEDKEI